MSAELRAVLDNPSRIVCNCGHTAYQHGAMCFECNCPGSTDAVIKEGYRKALSTALDQIDQAVLDLSLMAAELQRGTLQDMTAKAVGCEIKRHLAALAQEKP